MKTVEETKGKVVGILKFREKFPSITNSESAQKFGWRIRIDVHTPYNGYYKFKIARNRSPFDASSIILSNFYKGFDKNWVFQYSWNGSYIPSEIIHSFATHILKKNQKQITLREFEVKTFIEQERAREVLEA